jgi:hypothetical protein
VAAGEDDDAADSSGEHLASVFVLLYQ